MKQIIPLLLFCQATLGQNAITKFRGKIIQYSPDNSVLAVGGNNELDLYAPRAGEKIRVISNQMQGLSTLSFNESGQLLAAAANGSIKVWELKTYSLVYQLEGVRSKLRAMTFVKESTQLVGMDNKNIYIWDLASLKLLKKLSGDGKKLRGFSVSPDQTLLAVCGAGKSILVYSLDSLIVKSVIKSAHRKWIRTLTFDPKSVTLASGGDDGEILFWTPRTGTRAGGLPIQKGWITDVEYSPDARYLFSASNLGAINIYNLESNALHSKINIKVPALSISMNSNGKEFAGVEYGNKIKVWDVGALGITPVLRLKDAKDKSAPLILVSNPANIIDNRVIVYKDLIDLRGTVTDESGVRSLKINNINTPVRDNGNFLINIPLAMGDNYINVEVTDLNDNIALKKIILTRKSMQGENYSAAAAKNHLLVVGINNYQNWPKLNNAVKDANDIVSVLMSKYGFEFSQVTLLKDEQATRSNIYNGLRSLIEKVTPQDNLVIYFSGHGYFDQLLNEGYWIPVEARPNSSGDYISNTDILKILSNINSQHTFLIADACFSGALFADSRRGYTENVEKFKSRWGLASGRLETVSDGAIGGNSPFADKVLKFLSANEKEKFAISELIQFVKTQVAEETNQTPIGNPLRTLGDEGGEMVLYKKKK
jgi:WD40 repeat protein